MDNISETKIMTIDNEFSTNAKGGKLMNSKITDACADMLIKTDLVAKKLTTHCDQAESHVFSFLLDTTDNGMFMNRVLVEMPL